MHQSPSDLLEQYLNEQNINAQEFAEISGMPLTEVQGILNGDIPVTTLRANHLAAALNTNVSVWTNGKTIYEKKTKQRSQPCAMVGDN